MSGREKNVVVVAWRRAIALGGVVIHGNEGERCLLNQVIMFFVSDGVSWTCGLESGQQRTVVVQRKQWLCLIAGPAAAR